jgi:cell wall-associated NlpC family hydrolase
VTPPGHTAMVRRAVILLVAVAALAVGGGAWLAMGAAGKDTPPRAVAAATPAPAAKPTAKPDGGLPPLPRMKGTVVQPKAGASGAAADRSAPAPDSGLNADDPTPTSPATSGGRQPATIGGRGSVTEATALTNGIAVPPLEAPDAVRRMIEAGNVIARSPYIWGGGHGKWIDKGYDCSGSVSFVLAAAGYLSGPLDSGHLAQWGEPGPGKWVTIYANSGHVFMEVAGIRFDTVARAVTGSRWANGGRTTAGFAVRHPPGL